MTGKHVCFRSTRVDLGEIVSATGLAALLLLFAFVLVYSAGAQDVAAKGAPVAKPAKPATDSKAGKDAGDAAAKKPLAPTEITSDTLEYDFNKQVIVFAGNVKVVDNQLHLRAARMTVHLDKKTQSVKRIVAAGKVEMKTADGKATGEEAEYDLEKGRVVLSGEPIIHSAGGLMKGALKVVYDRKVGKFRTEGGNPRLEIRNANATDAVDKFIKRPDEKKKPKAKQPDKDEPAKPDGPANETKDESSKKEN